MQEMWVPSLGQEDPLEKEMATCSSILTWEIPWTEEPDGPQSMGSHRVKRGWATEHVISMEPLLYTGHSAWVLPILCRDRLKFLFHMNPSGPRETLVAPDQKVLKILKYFYCGKCIQSITFALSTISSYNSMGLNRVTILCNCHHSPESTHHPRQGLCMHTTITLRPPLTP